MERAHGKWIISGTESMPSGYIDFGEDKIEAYFFGVGVGGDELYIDNQSKYSNIDSAILISLEGKSYSCFNLSFIGNSFPIFAKSNEVLVRYSCQIVFSGDFAFDSLEDKFFISLTTETENILNWAGLQPYKSLRYNNVTLNLKKSKIYNYKGLKLFFGTNARLESKLPSVNIVAKGTINLKSNRLIRSMDLYGNMIEISSLLSILSRKSLSVYSQSIESKFKSMKVGNKIVRHSLIIKTRMNRAKDIDDWTFAPLIRLSDIDDFQEVLNIWENRTEVFNRAASVIMLAINRPGMILDSKYISIVSALESLCGEGEKQYYMDKANYKNIMKNLRQIYNAEITNETLLKVLEGRLSSANEISLQSKVIKVITDSYEIIRERTDMPPEDLAKALTDNRNYIAHNDSRNKKMIVKSSETLYWLCDYAGMLLLYKFYTMLNIDSDKIVWNIKQSMNNTDSD